jgi:hypothetical protein
MKKSFYFDLNKTVGFEDIGLIIQMPGSVKDNDNNSCKAHVLVFILLQSSHHIRRDDYLVS